MKMVLKGSCIINPKQIRPVYYSQTNYISHSSKGQIHYICTLTLSLIYLLWSHIFIKHFVLRGEASVIFNVEKK